MNFNEYQKMALVEDYYWWHIGRKFIIQEQLKQLTLARDGQILNIGCGTGGTVSLLEGFGQVLSIDTSEEAIRLARARGISNLMRVESIKLPFGSESFDMVIALDVLEHIEDETLALSEWYRVLRPGGYLFLTVPAYQWLWSEHDEALHHYRRYTAAQLGELTGKFNFQIVKRSYAITAAFFPIVGYRILRNFFLRRKVVTSYVILPKVLNEILVIFLKVEAHLLKFMNFPFGTSVLMICIKR